MDEMQGLFDVAARALHPLEDLFLATALASLRLFAAFNVLPAMGSQFIQGYVRAGIVVILGGYIAFGLPSDAASHLTAGQWAGFALKETMIGLMLGFAASTVFWIAECVGAMIDTQAGYNSVQLSNPMSGEQSTPVSNMLVQLLIAVFFALGGMLVFIGAVFDSFHIWPLFAPLPEVSRIPELFIVQQTDSLMTGTVKFAAPVLLVLTLIDLGIGLITRAADKLEPSNLSQPIKGAVTMLMLALLISVLVTQVRHLLLPTGLIQQLQTSLQAR